MEIGLNWYGMLTINNIEQVVATLRELLTGKRYTFVAVNMHGVADSGRGELYSRPEVRTGQELNMRYGDPFKFWRDENDEYAGFNVGDSCGVWGCSTSLQDDKYDPDFNSPYIVFEWNKVRITYRAGAGHLLYWIIAVEQE